MYSDTQYIVGNGHMGPPPVDRQTVMTEKITFINSVINLCQLISLMGYI